MPSSSSTRFQSINNNNNCCCCFQLLLILALCLSFSGGCFDCGDGEKVRPLPRRGDGAMGHQQSATPIETVIMDPPTVEKIEKVHHGHNHHGDGAIHHDNNDHNHDGNVPQSSGKFSRAQGKNEGNREKMPPNEEKKKKKEEKEDGMADEQWPNYLF